MHILQKKAKKTVIINNNYPDNAAYDVKRGLWVADDGAIVAYDANRSMSTKKEDIETGEDQKGQ